MVMEARQYKVNMDAKEAALIFSNFVWAMFRRNKMMSEKAVAYNAAYSKI
jgi:DNA segregation ATPase FtsK/SpoIIIE-like protein